MSQIVCYDSMGELLRTMFQWDTNQTITIKGAEVPPYPVFHFANRCSKEALVVTPEETGGTDLTVKVPNVLLQSAETIFAYLYYETDNDAYKTKHVIQIPVAPRAKPSDYEYSDNIDYVSVAAISTRLNEIIHLMTDESTSELAPEVIDIRIGSDGTVYQTAGEAVRSQVADLKSAIDEFNPIKTYLFEQGNYSAINVGQQLKPQDLAYVVRTKEFAKWSAGEYVSVKSGYKARLLLCDSSGNYIVDASWAQNVTSDNSTATQVMVCIKSDDNSALTPDMISDIVLSSTVNITVVHEKANQSDFIALETVVDSIVENGEAGVYNRINVTPVSGVMNKTGAIANIGQHTSITVSRGEKYEIIAYKYGNDYPAYIFRKDGAIVGYSENANQMFKRWLVVIPSGVDEVIVNANTYLLYVAKYQTVAPMPYSKWHGKKIAWFGTSIPEPSGYNPVTGYPEYVGELLGATIYNEAVGSSCARRGTRSAESENDPYGVTNMGIGALWSLGGTIAEKTELTTNWETKWRAITGYDAAMTDVIKDKAIACSYENKLMQYVTTNPVDLYVFDHGYNDWRVNSADNVANPDNAFDRSTYQGAMNTFIAAILAVNPHANIVLISHYETQREPGVIDMQESVAEYWGLPLIRICDKLGWAWDRAVMSTGYWQQTSGGGIWIESGGTSRSYRLPELHMQDGKHPNTDLSGKACMDIGNIIAAELNMLPPHK